MADETVEIDIVANDKASSAFDSATNRLLALGNIASSVDRIFSTYQNTQIRVENAQERVIGATDRLEDAQKDLERTLRDSSKSAEDVSDAQTEVERATRSLTISQNNLSKVNNAVIGNYINMGIQAITVVRSLGELWKWINQVQNIQKIWNAVLIVTEFLLNPIGAAIAVAAAALAVFAVDALYASSANEQFNASQTGTSGLVSTATSKITTQTEALREQSAILTELTNKLNGYVQGPMAGEGDALLEIADQEQKVFDIKTGLRVGDLEQEQYKLDYMKRMYNLHYTEQKKIFQDYADANVKKAQEAQLSINGSSFNIVTQMSTDTQTAIDNINKVFAELDKNIRAEEAALDRLMAKLSGRSYAVNNPFTSAGSSGGSSSSNPSTGPFGGNTSNPFTSSVHDAIIKPDGQIIKTDPRDTIIATKNGIGGGGLTLIIEGNIYGTDPDEMAKALYDKLRKKISL